MIEERACAVCNAVIEIGNRRPSQYKKLKTCSRRCRQAQIAKVRSFANGKPCAECGERCPSSTSSPRKYCSHACMNRAKQRAHRRRATEPARPPKEVMSQTEIARRIREASAKKRKERERWV